MVALRKQYLERVNMRIHVARGYPTPIIRLSENVRLPKDPVDCVEYSLKPSVSVNLHPGSKAGKVQPSQVH